MKTRICEDLADYYQLWRDVCLGKSESQKAEVDFLVSIFESSPEPIRTVIDLGGGVGIHAIPLLHRGLDVTLLDQSKKALSIAMSSENNLKTVEGSFETVNVKQRYDAVICMWSTLSYVRERKGQEHFYEWIREHATKMIILDQPNFALYPSEFHKVYEGENAQYRMKVTRDWLMRDNCKQTKFLYNITEKTSGHEEAIEDQEVQQYVTIEELKGFLGAEWSLEAIYGDYSINQRFDQKSSSRMITVFQPSHT